MTWRRDGAPLRSAPTMNRIEQMRALVRRHGLDGIVLTSSEYIAAIGGTYLFTQMIVPDRVAYLVVTKAQDPVLLVCNLEEPLARQQSHVTDVRTYVEFAEEPTKVLADILTELGLSKASIGIDGRRLAVESEAALSRVLPGLTLTSVDDDVERALMVKTPSEIDALASAARVTLDAIEQAIASTSLRSSERGLTAAIAGAVAEHGGALLFLVLGSGRGSMVNHLEAGSRMMRTGEIFRVDVGARFGTGMLSDVGRTGVVGAPSELQREILCALRDCQRVAIELVEPGRPARELFEACRRAFERHDLPWSMPHVGHGIGVGLHQQPRLHPLSDVTLDEGMVLNIEVLALMDERTEGYFTEDLVLVTPTGHDLLTTPQDDLLMLSSAAS